MWLLLKRLEKYRLASSKLALTRRWREMDSNFRFRSRGATIFEPLARKFRYRLIIQPGTAYRDVRTAGEPRSGRRPLEALIANGYGQFDELIRMLAPALGQTGLEHLKRRMIDLSKRPVTKPAEKERVKIGWSSSGPIYADEIAERSRVSTVRLALTEIC
jgi:hypothetical protein